MQLGACPLPAHGDAQTSFALAALPLGVPDTDFEIVWDVEMCVCVCVSLACARLPRIPPGEKL